MRGRPKLNDNDKRNKSYVIRFRNDEFDNLKKLAAGAGVSVAKYIRILVDREVMDTLMYGEKEENHGK